MSDFNPSENCLLMARVVQATSSAASGINMADVLYSAVSHCSWADAATNLTHIAASFDQEAAAVAMARMAVAR